MTKPDKAAIDWDRIEPDFRANIKSVLQIAAEYEEATGRSISHTAINKHFKKLGVTRDIRDKAIKEKVVLPPADVMAGAGFIYVIYIDTGLERFYKIGLAKHFSARFEQHQCSSPFDICVAMAYFVGNMRQEEAALHSKFKEQRVRGEWFRLSDDDLTHIATRALLV